MARELTFDPASFKALEYAGWQKGAASYDDLFGSITRHAMEPLLDATDVRAESSVLDVCCGLGYGAGAALSRGARPIGIDFAPAMVAAARERYPAAVFRQDDAEALNFDSGVFDAVICAFGVNHLQHPEKAIAEALRVLRPGGKYAFTMWCVPGRSKFHQLVLESIRSHGTLDVPLPAAPPPFRFSDPEVCTIALLGAGFVIPRYPGPACLSATNGAASPRSNVQCRSAGDDSFTSNWRSERAIHRAIVEGVARFRVGGKIEVPMPAVLASASRPS